jgi:hypothetical protein
MSYINEMEGGFSYLMERGRNYLTREELHEVKHRVAHKEYGLALQSFCYGFIAESRPLSKEAIAVVDELMTKMGMKDEGDDNYWCGRNLPSL